ncbi:MFS transporter [Burkholderia sp. Bp9126]|nr:MFS transporter [Burkholderia sp. Bp9126]
MRHQKELPPTWLVIALLALPQVAETILAPALPDIARVWNLESAQTQWVMGIFFLGFAIGVFVWGRVADQWGRRPAMLGGLTVALLGTVAAAHAPSYTAMLAGRCVQAVGLATCSVTTQTILRDRLNGDALIRYFVTLGIVLAWSPAVGPLSGQLLSDWHGYRAVLWLVVAILSLLLLSGLQYLPETHGNAGLNVSTRKLAMRMLGDQAIWRSAVLVASLNTLMFSFYAAGPFMVGHLPGPGFGWVGLAVALVSSLGAAFNHRLHAGVTSARRVQYGLASVLGGVILQLILVLVTGRAGILWAIAALPVFVGLGLAIPNILGSALRDYGDCPGRAGALFGVAYYTMLGAAIATSAMLPFDTPVPLSTFWLGITALLFLAHGNERKTRADRTRTCKLNNGG